MLINNSTLLETIKMKFDSLLKVKVLEELNQIKPTEFEVINKSQYTDNLLNNIKTN